MRWQRRASLRSPDQHGERVDFFIFAVVGIAAIVSWARILPRINGIDVLAVTAVLGGGYPVFARPLKTSSPGG